MEEKTRKRPAVYPRFISRTAIAFGPLLLTSVPTPICFDNPFHARCVREFVSVNLFMQIMFVKHRNLSSPKPEQTSGGSGRAAEHSNGAGQGSGPLFVFTIFLQRMFGRFVINYSKFCNTFINH